MSPNVLGALLMMASMACFTFNDTAVKLTGGALPLGQLLTLRGIFSTLLIFALARYLGALRFDLRWRDWMLVGIRSASEIAAAYFFITALMNMPLANVSAILQALPLTVTLGSALVFREAVGWRRAVAIGVGFVGMLLIVRPGPEGFNVWSLYGLAAVVSVTVRDLATRRLSPDVPGLTVTLSAAVAVLLFFAVFSLGETWQPVTPRLWALLVASSVFIFGGYYFSVQVMRTGDIAFIAPFRYTGLIWALVLGWLVFGDWPTPLTLLGAGIVVGMGLFTLYRERQLLGSRP
ncbi:DMT family transporter [Pseudosulfitobacter sp. DSM 107133]|uniref:DMT family transporter n=1 Tax=Pseudosulfitobacter sp. DSM 107133 TaxID=2883100 RepID=UPI000DF28744|nr:DMT family transporter [Pseudosulfitobacter sp. DSM 107133]UOA28335.1 Riboflavin transporter [Pseudosulfitobacter sp. DSM 107133]